MNIVDENEIGHPENVERVQSRGGELEVFRWTSVRGHTAVAAHGFLDHGRSWDGFAPHLRTIDLVSYSSRGHGHSDRADDYEWSDFVVDLAMVVRSTTNEPADLIGHSMGAHLSLELARACPNLVRRIVNIDGMLPNHGGRLLPELPERIRRTADRPNPDGGPVFPTIDDAAARRRELTPKIPAAFADTFARHGTVPWPGGFRYSLDPMFMTGTLPWDGRFGPFDVAAAIAKADVPILLITGGATEAPHLTPDRSAAVELGRLDHVEHVHFPDAGHYVHLEHPREVAAIIEEFLA